MPRVLVITNNLQQASFRLRIEALLPRLRERGFELEVQVRPRGLWARRRLLKSADRYDAVILQRKFLDPSDAHLLRQHAKRLIYDVDDAVMYNNHEVGFISRWRTARRFEATSRIVDHVVVGNAYLADLFRNRGCQTTILPTVVDVARYPTKEHQQTEAPALVWIGSHSTLPYLQQVMPHLEKTAESLPGLRLITIADATVTGNRLAIQHIPWTPETEAQRLILGDIGIAPTPLDQWTLGKCGFKIIQYMAAGLPVIASPVGANSELVWPGVTGLLPTKFGDWPAVVTMMAADVQMRRRMGAEGRRVVEERYTLDRAAEVWAGLLKV